MQTKTLRSSQIFIKDRKSTFTSTDEKPKSINHTNTDEPRKSPIVSTDEPSQNKPSGEKEEASGVLVPTTTQYNQLEKLESLLIDIKTEQSKSNTKT